MGQEKNAMIEADDRGWVEPEGYVCPDCVEDEYLKDVIRDFACQCECDYCGYTTDEDSAAPVTEIMEPICNAVYTWFNNPVDAGEFWDSEDECYLSGDDAIDTREMLESLPLECNELLFDEIAGAFVNNEWVETANGHWLGSHPHELMTYAWERFAYLVQHESRYFFQYASSGFVNQGYEYGFTEEEHYNPANFLPTLGELAEKLKMITVTQSGNILFRVRTEEKPFLLNSQELGAPPSKCSKAGRMNPAGISYMYLAFDQETALAEVRQDNLLLQTAIGQFEIQRELQILDLTNPPEKPSIFDEQNHEKLVGLLFIDSFVAEITKPTIKDGSEHIEYVPSQVVSEYFALVFLLENGKRLDGIKYRSSVRPGGHNLVLFPTERGLEPVFDQVELQNAWNYTE